MLLLVMLLAGCNFALFQREAGDLSRDDLVMQAEVEACRIAGRSPCLAVQTADADTPRPRPRPPGMVAALEPETTAGVLRPRPRPSASGDSLPDAAPSLRPLPGAMPPRPRPADLALRRTGAVPETRNPGGETELGRTVASLGAVAEPGAWLKTPLVTRRRPGRVVWEESGASVRVTLIPKPGAATAGSQISLAAMQGLGIPLTALAKLIVYAE